MIFFLKSKCVTQPTWAYKHISLKLHFHLTILISSRKLSIKLIIAIIYIISSSLFIEASMRIHQLKGMIHILTTIVMKITKTMFLPLLLELYNWRLISKCHSKCSNIFWGSGEMLPMAITRAHLVMFSCWQRTFQFHWLWWITSCDCLRNKFQERIWTSVQMPCCWAWRQGYLLLFAPQFQNTMICKENDLHFRNLLPSPGSHASSLPGTDHGVLSGLQKATVE